MRLVHIFVLGVICALLSFARPAAAQIQLGISGDAQIGANYIDFGQFPNGAPYTPAPGYGTFETSLVNAGPFSSVNPGEFGTIQSINQDGPVSLPSPFMTFDTGGDNLQLWATNVPYGAVGPYTLTDTADGAVMSFNVDGEIYDTNLQAYTYQFTGTFSATFDGQTVADLFTSLPENTPFTATFTTSAIPGVPEPASLGLIAASAGMGLARPRRRT